MGSLTLRTRSVILTTVSDFGDDLNARKVKSFKSFPLLFIVCVLLVVLVFAGDLHSFV